MIVDGWESRVLIIYIFISYMLLIRIKFYCIVKVVMVGSEIL